MCGPAYLKVTVAQRRPSPPNVAQRRPTPPAKLDAGFESDRGLSPTHLTLRLCVIAYEFVFRHTPFISTILLSLIILNVELIK